MKLPSFTELQNILNPLKDIKFIPFSSEYDKFGFTSIRILSIKKDKTNSNTNKTKKIDNNKIDIFFTISCFIKIAITKNTTKIKRKIIQPEQ